jgi:hypothetical protein
VIEEIAGFPFMSHDDLVDSTVMALMRFRQGGFIRLPSDEPDEIKYFQVAQAWRILLTRIDHGNKFNG